MVWQEPSARDIAAGLDKDGRVIDTVQPEDATCIVMQRVTHHYLLECIPIWQSKGIRVVVDVDDDLTCIHPSNRAFAQYRPSPTNPHSWHTLVEACRIADVVTVTSPALARRFRHDAVVLPNYLPDYYYGLEREDSTVLSWPAALHTHPNDADPISRALRRVVESTGTLVRGLGDTKDFEEFRRLLDVEPDEMAAYTSIDDWPASLARIGVGIAPLADTKFNEAKSWLKVLEMSACGVPWVASPRAEYRTFHEATGVGFLAERPREWIRLLTRLLTDDVLRKEQSEAGREAAEDYRLSKHIDRWAEVWCQGA